MKHAPLAILVALSLHLPPATWATPVYNVLLKTGDVAPCSDVAGFESFSQPVINKSGLVLFQAKLKHQGAIGTANDDGVWLWTPSGCECVGREGDPVPDIGGATFASLWLSNLRLDDGGFATLVATITGSGITTSNNTCFVWGKPGAMQVVARENDMVPGATEGERFDDLANLDGLKLVTGRPGEIGFVAGWRGPTSLAVNSGVWLGPATNLQLIARDGQAVPDGGGATFRNFQFRTAQLNRQGEVVFKAQTSDFPLDTGIWSGTTGGLRRVLAEGAGAAPVGAAHYGEFAFSAVTRNSSSQYCFVATFADVSSASNTAILAGPLTNLQVVAREGQHAPGTPNGVVFTDLGLSEPLYGEGGDVAFRATVSGPGIGASNNTAIWVGKPGALYVVDRRGSQARDLPVGVLHHTSLSSTFDLAGVNGRGNVAYISLIEGPGITLANNTALWAGSPGFENLLLQTGQGISLGGAQTGIVFTIDMVDVKGQLQVGGGADGRAQSLNDRNQYVAAVQFVAGTGGSALLRIEDVTDPEADGLSRILEEAHGVPSGEGPADAALQMRQIGDSARLTFRERIGVPGLAIAVEEAGNLVGGSWSACGVTVSNADDQSELPPGVTRREAQVPLNGACQFFRIGVSPLPPSQ